MDAVRKLRIDDHEDQAYRGAAEPRIPLDGLEKVLRFTFPAREEGPTLRSAVPAGLDIGRAIELVQEAAETIRAADERVRDGEARTQAIVMRAAEELKAAEARVQASEARARAAEARAQDAEARLKEAEGWLRQIFSTISEELPTRRPTALS